MRMKKFKKTFKSKNFKKGKYKKRGMKINRYGSSRGGIRL